jgi:hypothetical protein
MSKEDKYQENVKQAVKDVVLDEALTGDFMSRGSTPNARIDSLCRDIDKEVRRRGIRRPGQIEWDIVVGLFAGSACFLVVSIIAAICAI